jgi:hypothetical protein
MLPRERVNAALEFKSPDIVPVRLCPAAGGFHDHGQKLLDLMRKCGNDFGDVVGLTLPEGPRPEDFDSDGRYHAFRTDEWGTRWEYRIYGVWGHPTNYPLEREEALDTYKFPGAPALSGTELQATARLAAKHRERYYHLGWGGSILERMIGLRRYEDILTDIMIDSPFINSLADRLTEYTAAFVQRALAEGADGVAFSDDFGTTQAPIFSPETWRHFFKPRYETLVKPVRAAGKRAFLHSCGQIGPLLEDIADIGFSVVWPQLPLFDLRDLSKRCRELGLAVELHPDRGDLMQQASPQQVRDYVLRLVDDFRTTDGGSWLYLEVDPNFPWANVEALFGAAMELRR